MLKKIFLLLLIFFIAGLLRFYNLMHDAPYFFNPDERNMAGAISQFRLPANILDIPSCILSDLSLLTSHFLPQECNLNPHFFAYGQFPLYVAFASDQIVKSIDNLFPFQPITHLPAEARRAKAGNPQLTTEFPSAIFYLRFWSALFSTFTVLLVYLISRKLLTYHLSLLTMTFAAFTPGLIQSAHFGTTESLLTFFFMASLYLSLRYLSNLGHLSHLYPSYAGLSRLAGSKQLRGSYTRTNQSLKGIFLLSLSIGLSMGAKLTGIFFFFPPFLCLVLQTLQRTQKKNKRRLLGYLLPGLLIFTGSLIFFILSSPYNVKASEQFLSAVFGYEKDVATGAYEAFYTRQFVDTTPLLFQAEKMFPYALGWPIFVLGILGFLLIIRNFATLFFKAGGTKGGTPGTRWAILGSTMRVMGVLRDRTQIIIIVSFLFYLIPNAFLFAKWTRFMTPILPFFSIFSAFALLRINKFIPIVAQFAKIPEQMKRTSGYTDRIFKYEKYKNALGYWVIGLLIIISILPGLMFMSIYMHKDTRVQASEWIYKNIPDNSYILSETGNVVDIPLSLPSYNLQPTTYNLNVISFDFYHLDENPLLFHQLITHLEKSQYIFIPSRRIFANYPRLPHTYPLVAKYYDLLFSQRLGFEKVAEISSFPSLSLITYHLSLPDENAEETYTVFDHPVIRIYRKINPLTKDQYQSLFER